MAVRSIRREATNPAAHPGTTNTAPIYVDSDTNTAKYIPTGSGTTEVEIADVSATQTFTNKTVTAPVLSGTVTGTYTLGGTPTLSGPTISGTVTQSGATTMSGGVEVTTSPLGVADDISIELGTSDDSVIRHVTAINVADTALTDVLVGTPVTEATAANSTILSNITASGDFLLALNRGGNSEAYIWADSSAGALHLTGYQGGITLGLAADQVAADEAGVHIWDGSAGAIAATTDSRLIVESSDATANYLQFLSPNAAVQGILFGDVDDADIGSIKYNHTGNTLEFTKGTAAINMPDVNGVTSGLLVGATITYTQDATSVTHTGTVEIPANATLNNIVCNMGVLWTPTGTASWSVGDDDSATGWFNALNMKATDWLVGEVLDITNAENWGAKQGAYLVAATGRKGQAVAAYSGTHTTAATEVIGVATIATPANTAGRTYMTVSYLAPTAVAATVA